jgi:16S rRNA (guanine966-N2)-methyltransferase
MADRAKQALFDVLGPPRNVQVLDLYAGSGALGIEALSRGAAHATFVESSRTALAAIRHNLAELGLYAETTVVPLPVERSRPALKTGAPYGLVFCAPPWAEVDRALRGLSRVLLPGLLSAGALAVVDHRASHPTLTPPHADFEIVDRRAWGDTGVTLLRYAPPPNQDPGEMR